LVLEGAGQLLLLTEKDVQADLGLREADRQRVDEIARKFTEQSLALLHGDQHPKSHERRARFLDLARSSEREMRSILSDGQVQRLEQIRIQLVGFLAFSEPKIVKTLGLAESQREAIRQIEAETFLLLDERQTLPDDSARQNARANLLGSAMDRCLAVLSPTQLSQWQDLTDRPFQGRLSRRLPGMLP
jgi:hypothetical protein